MNTPGKANRYYPYIFIAFFIFLLFPTYFFLDPGQGPEASGDIALHLARQYRLVFGKEIVPGYGPLGFLQSRLPIAVNVLVYLFFDGYFLFTLFLVLRRIFRDHFSFGVVAFIFLAIVINMEERLGDWFFFFLLFYLFSFLREPSRKVYLLQAALLGVIGLYFRADTGMLGVVLYLAVIVFGLIRKKISVREFAWTAVFFLLVILAAGYFLRVNLGGYIRTSLHLLNDYGEARFQPAVDKDGLQSHLAMEVMVCVVYWILCLLVLVLLRREKGKRADELFVCVCVGLAALVYFKGAFVRADEKQVFQFFGTISLLIGFFYLHGPAGVWRRVPVLGCWVVLALSILAVSTGRKPGGVFARMIHFSFISDKARGVGNYFSGLLHYNRVSAELASKAERAGTELKKAIGGHSADIIPWEVSKIWSNGLRYDPRPVFQSYSASSAWLDSLNYEKYMSREAPDYVLLSFAALDGHLPFFDEARTKLAVIDRYDPVTLVDGELLLKRTDRHRLTGSTEETTDVQLNTDIRVKKSKGLQFSRFFIHYDGAGKLGHLLDQPPRLKLVLTLDNGSQFIWRISKTVLEDGIIVNKYVDGEEELQLLMQAQGGLTPNISRIRIQTDPGVADFIKAVTMVNRSYTFNEKGPEERAADSMAIARLYDQRRPQAVDPGQYKPGKIPYKIHEFNTFSQFIRVYGYIPYEKAGDTDLLVNPVLRSRDGLFELPVKKRTGSLFLSVAAKDLLPPGDYKLGLAYNGAGGAKTVCYTDRNLFIPSDYKISESGPMLAANDGNIDMKYNVDRAVTWKGEVFIEGWARLLTKDTARQTAQIVLTSKTRTYRLTTDAQERTDVGGPWNYCGFSVKIPEDKLVKDSYIIGVELSSRHGKFKNLQFSSRILTIGIETTILPEPVSELPPVGDFLSSIDRQDDQKEFLTLAGWAIRDMKDVPNSQIDILFKGDSVSYLAHTNLDKRSDLTAKFHNAYNLDNCGFAAKISKEDMLPGKYQIGIRVHRKGEPGVVKFLSLYTVRTAE